MFWLILNDCMGAFCALITYIIVLAVQVGFIRIGLWEGLLK